MEQMWLQGSMTREGRPQRWCCSTGSSQADLLHVILLKLQSERGEMGASYSLEIMQLWHTRSGLTKADIGFLFNEFLLIYHRVDFNLLGMSRTEEINVLFFFLMRFIILEK